MPPPGAGAGKHPGNSLEKAWNEGWTAKWAELVEKADTWMSEGSCAPFVRIYRVLTTPSGVEFDHAGDDMPIEELANACSWLAGVFGPGKFRLDVLDSRGARTLGAVTVHVGADKRAGRRPQASPNAPGAPIGEPATTTRTETDLRLERLERYLMGQGNAYPPFAPPAPPPDPVAQVAKLAGVLGSLPQAAGMAQPATPDVIERAVKFGAEMAAKQLVNAVVPAAPTKEPGPWWSEHLDGILGAGNAALERIFESVDKVVEQVKAERKAKDRKAAAPTDADAGDDDELDAEIVEPTPTPTPATAPTVSGMADAVRRAAEANNAPATPATPAAAADDDDDDDGGASGAASVH